MADRVTSRETLRAGTPITVGAVTLVPIERIVLHADLGGTGAWMAAAKEPYALVLREPGRIRAVDAAARQLALESLCAQVPELDALLASL